MAGVDRDDGPTNRESVDASGSLFPRPTGQPLPCAHFGLNARLLSLIVTFPTVIFRLFEYLAPSDSKLWQSEFATIMILTLPSLGAICAKGKEDR